MTTADDAKVRISKENVVAVQPLVKEKQSTLTAQVNFILDGWRADLRNGKKLPGKRKAKV